MLKNVIGQDFAKRHLHQAARSGRLAHAYLFAGEDGYGAEELALELGRYLMCLQPDTETLEYCGHCAACRKTAGLEHPDLHYYFPMLKSTEEETICEWFGQKAKTLYTRVKVAGGSIHIGDPENPGDLTIRGLIRDVSLRAFEGGRKIYILTFIEEMNAESANAFLKVLEEPPDQTFFLLTTSQLPAILPTIVSRCQLLRLQPVREDDLVLALTRDPSLSPERARLVARLANGRVHQALQMLNGTLEARRDLMLDFLLAAVHPRSGAIPVFVNNAVKTYKKEKDVFIDMLTLLLSWFQDIHYAGHLSGQPEQLGKFLINTDKWERLRKFCAKFPGAQPDRMAAETEKAVDLISRNAYLNAVLTQLALRLRQEAGIPL